MSDGIPPRSVDDKELEGEAAELAETGFEYLISAHFDPVAARVAIARLLQSISYDRRAGNRTRPEHIFEIVESLLRELERDVDERVLIGLAREWIGDGKLMLGRTDAIDQYRSARECYDDLTWEETTWRDEPEFMRAYWAIQEFSRFHDGPLPESPDIIPFEERIRLKIEFTERFLDVAEESEN